MGFGCCVRSLELQLLCFHVRISETANFPRRFHRAIVWCYANEVDRDWRLDPQTSEEGKRAETGYSISGPLVMEEEKNFAEKTDMHTDLVRE